jgi:hypothetical protein
LSLEARHTDSESTPVISEEAEGYEYIADVKAIETFRNTLRGLGITPRERDGRKVAFTSEKLLDMKGMKERGLLWSYAVAKVKRVKELLEVG